MRPPTSFVTERLRLRPVQHEDAVMIFQTYAGEERPTRYMDFARHRSLSESESFARRCVACWTAGAAFPWAILEKNTLEFMGVIELRLAPPKADFGYIFGERFWGKGFATEAATRVAAWAMEQPSIHRLWATCHPQNIASTRVLEKLGLEVEATFANGVARPQLGELAGASVVFAKLKRGLMPATVPAVAVLAGEPPLAAPHEQALNPSLDSEQ